jgi:outer membrane protein assembly factor BamB
MTMLQPSSLYLIGLRRWRRVARACMIVAAGFCVFMAAMLGTLWMQDKTRHPLIEAQTGRVAAMRTQLQTRPADEALLSQLRQADKALRQAYFTRRTQMARGAWLLLAGAVVLAAGLKTMRALERNVPAREDVLAADRTAADMRWAQWTVAGMGGAITALLLGAAWWSLGHPALPVEEKAAPVAQTPVTTEELLAQWPAFRGWGGAAARAVEPSVRTWDGKAGQNILWRTEVPLPGNSSPVVWENTVIVSGANESERKIMAFDLATGKPLWQTAVGAKGQALEVFEETSAAAPTPVTDGRRAYALFASGDIGAVDLGTGRKLWEKNLGKPESTYGVAASLAVFADGVGSKVIVQWDMAQPEDKKSSLIALDGRTGKVVWQTKRPVGNSWASPLVTQAEGDASPWQVVTAANPWVIGYDAANGAELWRVKALSGDVAPSPVAAMRNGKTYVVAAEKDSAAVGLAISQARGEIAPAWKLEEEGLPDLVSPVSDGTYVWTVVDSGTLYCFDLETGKKVWEHESITSVHATPVLIGSGEARELWVTEFNGTTHRIAAEGAFREIGTCALGEDVKASFAFGKVNGGTCIVIRGKKHLYGIGGSGAASGPAATAGAGGEAK